MTPTPKDIPPPSDYDARINPGSWGDRKHDPGQPDDVSDTADPNDPMTLRPGGSSEERLAAAASVEAAQKQRDEAAYEAAEKARLKAEAEEARLQAIDEAREAAAKKAAGTSKVQ